MLKLLLALTCLLLNACMVGPDYREPGKKIAEHWLPKKPVDKSAQLKNANWWKAFHDPTLTALIKQGYCNNLSLQIAGVRVLQARAQLAQSVGQLYPQQQALIGNYTYNRIGGGMLQDIIPTNFDTASLGFTAGWEIDFWGKYRRAVQANDASFLASVAAYDNALVSLTADIASTYIRIRTLEELIRITKKNIQIQTESLKIATARYRGGETSLLDVNQAQTELSETQATLPNYLSSLQSQKDKLGVLLGTTPDKVDALLANNKKIPKAPAKIAVNIPREALAQRPDIYQARMEAVAQSAKIGATKASLYPALSLTGTFLFAANTIGDNSISDIFQWSNRSITAGPSLNWPLLNYGQITNAVRMQDAEFQKALLNYMNLVLKAQQEVQDNITRFIETQNAARSLTKANRSAIESTNLALIRYKQGEADYTTLLDVERQQLRVQLSLTNTQGEIAQAMVELYRALGGGWQIRGGNDIVPIQVKAEMASRTNWGNLLEKRNHLPPQTGWERMKELYLPNW
ncbi:efflux transporter outer membrane subunit [Legionella londiniensis]|uniref:Outer membrane efflux protein n=1 Tax=Legionella londiniensis TaxID=45068 RepID=A0A0W0VR19_9GAMM|nr:efflux transporter outer membrane subunit [Legionella londiniensis]KTD22560.1 outer membrane efflux protein [Legionella londiniensis]STX92491.1 outer membrane efflux protein [Legionella londiniensis]